MKLHLHSMVKLAESSLSTSWGKLHHSVSFTNGRLDTQLSLHWYGLEGYYYYYNFWVYSFSYTYIYDFIGEGSFGFHQLTFIVISSSRLIVFHLGRVSGRAGVYFRNAPHLLGNIRALSKYGRKLLKIILISMSSLRIYTRQQQKNQNACLPEQNAHLSPTEP
jgi:hypothetical protein